MRTLLLFLFLHIACYGQEADVFSRLKHLAENQELGYKAANLYELAQIFEKWDFGKNIQIRIPDFYAISSFHIQYFLKENGLDLAQEWNHVLQSLSKEERDHILEDKQIGASFSLHLQTLREKIKVLFQRQISPFLVSEKFLSFLEKSPSLIVRSSGREDQMGLANAGGNSSIKNVAPSIQAIQSAIGEVIASYLSEKSVSQRLLFNDQTLFESPFTPVLIQEMVESIQRPIEGVVHTTEQSGPTEDLVFFNCGYDVVDSKTRADLYYYFHSKVGHAVLAKNVEHLSLDCRFAIAAIAQAIQKHYKIPIDIELLVTKNGDTFTIHLVQARPLCNPFYKEAPSFIANLKELPKERIVQAETIVATGSCTRLICDRDQLIFAHTLQQAAEDFLFHTTQKDKIVAIIVKREAEPNSHEATTFAACGKMVLKAADFDFLQSFFESGSFLLDPQQGVIVKDDDKKKVLVQKGFVSHPMPFQTSIETHGAAKFAFPTQEHFLGESSFVLFEILKKGEEQEGKRVLSSLLYRLQEEISLLKQEISEPFIEEALSQLYSLSCFAEKKACDALEFLKLPSCDLRRLAAIKPIEALFFQNEDPDLEMVYSLDSVLQKMQKRKRFLNPLHNSQNICKNNLKILDSLSDTYESALTEPLKKRWLSFISELSIVEIRKLSDMIDTLRSLGCLSTWMQMVFVKGYSFSELYNEYQKELEFANEIKKQEERLSCISISNWGKPEKFESLINSLPFDLLKSEKLKEIFTKKGMLSQILALSFMSRFIDLFDDQYVKTFLASSEIPQSLKLQNFKTIIDAYFSLLKAWEPLSTLTQEMKSWAFADFLDDVRTDVPNLFKSLDPNELSLANILQAAQFLPEEAFDELPQTTKELIQINFPSVSLKEGCLLLVAERFNSIVSFQSYIEKMEYAIASINSLNELQLFPPPDFHVDSEIYINIAKQQKAIGFEGYTLAAFFTLIHQNINTILTNLSIRCGLDQFERPDLLAAAESKIRNLGFLMDETGQIKQPSLIGTKSTKEGLTLIYNLPLKLHGVTYEIKYRSVAENIFLKINFVSVDNDLPTLAKLFTLGAEFLGAKEIETDILAKDMQASFTLDSSFQMSELDLFLQCMHELTSSQLKMADSAVKHTKQFLSLLGKDANFYDQFQTNLKKL